MGEWRLTLDNPIDFSVRPAHVRSKSFADFAPQADSFDGTYREPSTGVVGLIPCYYDGSRYAASFVAATQWRIAATWMPIKRADLQAVGLASILSNAQTPPDMEIVCTPYLPHSTAVLDTLVWAMESKFTLPSNAGFSFVMMPISDEVKMTANFAYVQWGKIGIHLAMNGVATVYQYGSSMAAVPTLIHQFEFATPNDCARAILRLNFIPIPGLGLACHVLRNRESYPQFERSVRAGSGRAELIPFPSVNLADSYHMFSASVIRLAVNPYLHWLVLMQPITYPTSGTFDDATWDPGFKPTVAPDILNVIQYPVFGSPASASGGLQKPDLFGAWDPATDRQARTRVSLSTTNNAYTPWVAGWDVGFPASVVSRGTTPFEPHTVQRIEYTVDEWARGEGTADFLLFGATQISAGLRGDATFLLERREGSGAWATIDGGLAVDWRPEYAWADGNEHLACTVSLKGLWHRFKETNCQQPTMFDGMSIGNAINRVLYGAGFATIADADMPDAAKYTMVPHYGGSTRPRWAPQPRTSVAELVKCLLLHLKTSADEYRLWYSWAAQKWVLDLKPKLTSTWKLYPRSTLVAGATQTHYSRLGGPIEAPECNLLVVEGCDIPGSKGKKYVNYLRNTPSTTDPTSPDYLGRTKLAVVQTPLIDSQEVCDFWCRAIYDACAHRRVQLTARVPFYRTGLDMARCEVRRDDGTLLMPTALWAKSVTANVEGPYGDTYDNRKHVETMTLALDTVWDGELSV